MARLTAGIHGPLIGTIGNVVASSRNGVPYIKSAYKSRTKSVSDRELANRKKFKVAQHWLQPLTWFVRAGFNGYSERSYGFVAAKSYLLKHAMEVDNNNNPIVNPALVKVSYGELLLPESITVANVDNKQVEFSWHHKMYSGYLYDQAMMLAYNIEKRKAQSITTGPFRKEGKGLLPITENGTYHLYLAFVASDRSKQSDSIYLGELTF
jgi:hypothetical protein